MSVPSLLFLKILNILVLRSGFAPNSDAYKATASLSMLAELTMKDNFNISYLVVSPRLELGFDD